MEIIYSGGSIEPSCVQARLGFYALFFPILGGIIGLILWLSVRFWGGVITIPSIRQLTMGFIVVGCVTLPLVLGILFDGPEYRRISFSETEFVFQGCDGLSRVTQHVPLAEVQSLSYSDRMVTQGRSTQFKQFIVLKTRMDRTFEIPLWNEPEITNHTALRRILPTSVRAAYLTALDRNGLPRPAAYNEPQ